MSLSLESRRTGGITVIACSGRIVEGAESAALQRTFDALGAHDHYVVLDVGGVEFIDSSGLGLLVRLLGRAHSTGGDIVLSSVPPRMAEILRVTKLRSVLPPHQSEAEAIAAIYARAAAKEGSPRLANDVLCVSASSDVLAYVAEIVRQAGFGVLSSDNLPDALMLLRAARPKLVIVDAALRSLTHTNVAQSFNKLAGERQVIELPGDFSSSDAGDTGARLLAQVRSALGDPSRT